MAFLENLGLISEYFSLWLKSQKKGAKFLYCALSTKRKYAHDSDLAILFGDLSQSEKLFVIKPHLNAKYSKASSHTTLTMHIFE